MSRSAISATTTGWNPEVTAAKNSRRARAVRLLEDRDVLHRLFAWSRGRMLPLRRQIIFLEFPGYLTQTGPQADCTWTEITGNLTSSIMEFPLGYETFYKTLAFFLYVFFSSFLPFLLVLVFVLLLLFSFCWTHSFSNELNTLTNTRSSECILFSSSFAILSLIPSVPSFGPWSHSSSSAIRRVSSYEHACDCMSRLDDARTHSRHVLFNDDSASRLLTLIHVTRGRSPAGCRHRINPFLFSAIIYRKKKAFLFWK